MRASPKDRIGGPIRFLRYHCARNREIARQITIETVTQAMTRTGVGGGDLSGAVDDSRE